MARPNITSLAELMDHPAGRFRKPLILLRSLQVLFGVVQFIIVCITLSQSLQAAAARLKLQPEPVTYDSFTYNQTMGTVGVMLFVTAASITFSCLWLYFTVRPVARNRSCGCLCWRGQCQSYGCEFGWDVTWCVLWGLYFVIVCVGGGRAPGGTAIAAGLFTFVMLGLFIAAAAITSRVRQRLRWAQTTNQDVECTSGIVVRGSEGISPSPLAPSTLQLSHVL